MNRGPSRHRPDRLRADASRSGAQTRLRTRAGGRRPRGALLARRPRDPPQPPPVRSGARTAVADPARVSRRPRARPPRLRRLGVDIGEAGREPKVGLAEHGRGSCQLAGRRGKAIQTLHDRLRNRPRREGFHPRGGCRRWHDALVSDRADEFLDEKRNTPCHLVARPRERHLHRRARPSRTSSATACSLSGARTRIPADSSAARAASSGEPSRAPPAAPQRRPRPATPQADAPGSSGSAARLGQPSERRRHKQQRRAPAKVRA